MRTPTSKGANKRQKNYHGVYTQKMLERHSIEGADANPQGLAQILQH